MTAKEYLIDKTLVAVEIVSESVILNLVTEGDVIKGMRVDTTNIVEGTILDRRTDFIQSGDIIYCAGLSIDTSVVQVTSP